MATYYVSTTTGNNANNGTSAATPWLTLAFALGAASGTNPGLVGGDIVYIAPGNYNESVTPGLTSPSSTVQILGDPQNLQGFPSVTAGLVYWYNSNYCLLATSKNNLTFKNIYFERQHVGIVGLYLENCYSWTFQLCVFGSSVTCTVAQSTALNLTVDRCIWPNVYISNRAITIQGASGADYDITTVIKDCLVVGQAGILSMTGNIGGVTVTNCTILTYDQAIRNMSTNTTHKLTVKNCLIVSQTAIYAGYSGTTVGDFNHRIQGGVTNVAETNTITTIQLGFDAGYARLTNLGLNDFFGSYLASPNLGTGTATGAPTNDLYGVTWAANPDIGAVTYKVLAGVYTPTERNASTITIAPASTSQSIELYLGVTGLTFSTSGLAAYYVRNQSAPVAITLVTQTATGAWSSGGFAEIDSSTVPGVYRLDVPNAAFAAGASDVTIVVRGASGTNGAVLTVTLSSGGLTAAQTAAAVFDAVASSYTTAGSMGARLLKTTVDNRPADVGASHHIHANIHAIVDSTAAASELSGALLHNGTDYIDSNLISGNSTRVFVGRFDLRQTGSETVDTIEVFTTDTPSFELQLTDGDGNSVPVTGATLGLRILDVASTVVETGTPTVEYGTGGIVRWTGPGTYLAIGCPVGNYRLFIDRTVSGTTTTFGPLQIRVQAQ
jgi:hypothetical protein